MGSPEPKYTLSGHFGGVNCLDFFMRGGQQHLVTGSDDITAKIWDLKERMCVYTLRAFMSPVVSVVSHPTLPVLIAATKDGVVHLWSSADFRQSPKHMRVLHINKCGVVSGLACSTRSRRVVIGDSQTVSIVEIHDEEPVAREGNNEIIYELPRWCTYHRNKQFQQFILGAIIMFLLYALLRKEEEEEELFFL